MSYSRHKSHLGYWEPGDFFWTPIYDVDGFGELWDIHYFNGKFYVITSTGVWVIDEDYELQLVIRKNKIWSTKAALSSQVSGALLFVSQFCNYDAFDRLKTYKFRVWKLDLIRRKAKEIRVLGDRAIFLGKNGSISIDTSKSIRVKPNHIYFTNISGRDMGAYSLQDCKIQSSYPGISVSLICTPYWVITSLWYQKGNCTYFHDILMPFSFDHLFMFSVLSKWSFKNYLFSLIVTISVYLCFKFQSFNINFNDTSYEWFRHVMFTMQ